MFGTQRSKRNSSTENLLVVGNGIASLRFCEEAVARGLNQRCRILVIGGEAYPAYDRVRLSRYVKERSAESLFLKTRQWYEDHDIELKTGDEVTKIDPTASRVFTQSGAEFGYNRLILATGSSAFVPPIAGVNLKGVHVYRTIADLDEIISAAKAARDAVVIGGGLLGLEAAQALEHLGLNVSMVERAEFPMPRQLNQTAGEFIIRKIQDLGIRFQGGFSTEEIRKTAEQLELVAADSCPVSADLIIISAGISPNSQIAEQAGLHCGVRGGVIVDDRLRTSDPNILAIGECALHEGQIYGLAAPAADMARYAARSLSGKKLPPFKAPDLSTRLKMLGMEVVSIGNALDRGDVIEFQGNDCYRLINLNKNRVPVGAIGVGEWPEASLIHGWYLEGRALREREIERFVAGEFMAPAAANLAVTQWPDERLVCNCRQVSKGALCHAMAKGSNSVDKLANTTGASSVCGSCLPLLQQLCGAPVTERRGRSPAILIGIAILALLLGIGTVAIDIPHASSVESWSFQLDQLWSNPLPKQITGYSLLGVSVFGLLISLRKRLPKFRFGSFAKWRVFHAIFGLVSLVVLFSHTGFRFGSNLNASLMTCFVGLNVLGALAGIAAGLETRGSPHAAMFARRTRPGLIIAHYVLFWPLPVLLAFHIASAYLY